MYLGHWQSQCHSKLAQELAHERGDRIQIYLVKPLSFSYITHYKESDFIKSIQNLLIKTIALYGIDYVM